MQGVGTYDNLRERLSFYRDAYWGGDDWRTPSAPVLGSAVLMAHVYDSVSKTVQRRAAWRYRTYLQPFSAEDPVNFESRIQQASYINVCKPCVDTYVDSVTSDVVTELGNLKAYVDNLDGKGRTWERHRKEVARWMAVYGFVFTVWDAPRQNPAANLAEEKVLGVGLRCAVVHPTAVAWIKYDDAGDMCEFAYVSQPYTATDVGAREQQIDLWLYRPGQWQRRRGRIDLGRTLSSQQQSWMGASGQLLDEGSLPPSLGKRLPVDVAFFAEKTESMFPVGVGLLADTADMGRSIFNLMSIADDYSRKTVVFLAVPTRDAGGGLNPDVEVVVGLNRGFPFDNDTGRPEWIAPPTEPAKDLRDHALFRFSLALRLAGLEVVADTSKQVQGSQGLSIRSRGFEQKAGSFAANLADYEHRALGTAALFLGRPGAEKEVSITYPSEYTLPDPDAEMGRGLAVLKELGQQLGERGLRAAHGQILNAALGLQGADLQRAVAEMKAAPTPEPAPMLPPPMGKGPGPGKGPPESDDD